MAEILISGISFPVTSTHFLIHDSHAFLLCPICGNYEDQLQSISENYSEGDVAQVWKTLYLSSVKYIIYFMQPCK